MKFIEWIIYSSKNPEKLSLFFKSLVAFIPTAVSCFALLHIYVTPESLGAVLDSIATTITAVGSAVLALTTLYGAIRKVVTALMGTNAVLNQY